MKVGALLLALWVCTGVPAAAQTARGTTGLTRPVTVFRASGSGAGTDAVNPLTSKRWAVIQPQTMWSGGTGLGAYGLSSPSNAGTFTMNETTDYLPESAYTVATGITIGQVGARYLGTSVPIGRYASNPQGKWIIHTRTDLSTYRLVIGFIEKLWVNGESNGNNAYVLFKYSSAAAAANWWCCYSNGDGASGPDATNEECVDSSVAVALSTRYKLEIERDGTNYVWTINDTDVCSVSTGNTKVPATTDPIGWQIAHAALAASARTIAFETSVIRWGDRP